MEGFGHTDVPAGIAINAHIAGLRANIPVNASQAEEAKGTEAHDVAAFKRKLHFCIRSFQNLIEEMLEASKKSILAKYCFHPIIRQIDDELVRLEIWASDIGAQDPDLGRSNVSAHSHLELTIYVTSILEGITSRLEGVRKNVQGMRASIERLSRDRSANPKRTAELDKLSKIIDAEHRLIVAAIQRLVDLTEAFRMELANSLQSGPLFEMRAQILRSREQVLRKAKPNTPRKIEESSMSSQGSPERSTRESVSSDVPERGPWHGKTMLSFDSGGSRNYASLLLLKALIEEIAALERDTVPSIMSSADPLPLEPRNRRRQLAGAPAKRNDLADRFLPCHYFDYIAGTGFGGIIAIMLGRLRMTVHECIEAYVTLMDGIWSHARIFYRGWPLLGPWYKYEHERLSNILKKIVEVSALGTMYPQINEDMCRTIVTACLQTKLEFTPYLFHSYHHPKPLGSGRISAARNPGPPNNYPIWQVGRAATASPPYFPPLAVEESGNSRGEFIAHGFSGTLEAYKSVQHLTNNDPGAVRVIVSIPSAKARGELIETVSGSPFLANLKSLLRMPNLSEEMERRTEDLAKENGTLYFRLNVKDSEFRNLQLDTWKGKKGSKTLEMIRAATATYLSSELGRKIIGDTARELVKIRQARSIWQSALGEWETFCHGVDYSCPLSQCKRNCQIFRVRGELRLHLERVHCPNGDTLEALLDKGKRYPR